MLYLFSLCPLLTICPKSAKVIERNFYIIKCIGIKYRNISERSVVINSHMTRLQPAFNLFWSFYERTNKTLHPLYLLYLILLDQRATLGKKVHNRARWDFTVMERYH